MSQPMMNGKALQPAEPDRQLTIGSKTLTVRYSLKAMRALQDHYGAKSLGEVTQRLGNLDQFGVGEIVAVIWAGTRRHHPEMTLAEVEDLLDDAGLQNVMPLLVQAIGAAMPPAPAKGAEGAGEGAAGPQ